MPTLIEIAPELTASSAPRMIEADAVIAMCHARAAELDNGSLRARLDAPAVRAAKELMDLAERILAMAAN